MDLFSIIFLIVAFIVLTLAVPVDLQKENVKRKFKGKPPLTAHEFQQRIKKVRLITALIFAALFFASVLIRGGF
ncbi:MAG: hypothetical protein FWD82_05735 [Defluviitaleaceae bacterium]|nr:hypothetical protein [Defluviitaleaceae bacterium]